MISSVSKSTFNRRRNLRAATFSIGDMIWLSVEEVEKRVLCVDTRARDGRKRDNQPTVNGNRIGTDQKPKTEGRQIKRETEIRPKKSLGTSSSGRPYSDLFHQINHKRFPYFFILSFFRYSSFFFEKSLFCLFSAVSFLLLLLLSVSSFGPLWLVNIFLAGCWIEKRVKNWLSGHESSDIGRSDSKKHWQKPNDPKRKHHENQTASKKIDAIELYSAGRLIWLFDSACPYRFFSAVV